MRDDFSDAAQGGAHGRDEAPLTDLQQAYLLGRERHLPLGGVAMQEFREYRGAIDIEALPQRLLALVGRHPALRTRIDAQRRVSWVSSEPTVNYDEIDLRGLSHAEALAWIDGQREDYAHRLFDLARSPWNVTAFRLQEPEADDSDQTTYVLFARFDALILDGRAIALLLVELLGGEAPAFEAAALPQPADEAKRREDAAYWVQKLQPVEGSPQLPWTRPLEAIPASRYERESLTIARERFVKLCRLAARERLFKNTAVTAVILETLSHWQSEGSLCVGIPVAPAASAELANRSSFIAVNWDARQGGFRERVQALQGDVLEGLEHLSQSGVQISRLLMNAHPGGPALPVVVTNGLGWPKLAADAGIRRHGGLTQTPQVAIDIRFRDDDKGNLVVDIDHAREAIDRGIISDILAALDRQVAAICERSAFEIVRGEVLDLGHYRLNGSEDDFTCSRFLQRIADNLFAEGRDKIALISGARRVSYAELGADVGKALAALRKRGVSKGDVVAICLPRGPEHTAITLACALSGAIWVPIDAASPPERLDYLLANCRPALVVSAAPVSGHEAATPEALLAGEPPADPLALLPALDALSASGEPAYYLYTSGTTGRPKCVVLSNWATSNVIGRTLENWQATESDVFISVTPLHHDMSIFDVFGCLTAGATLVQPAPGEEKDAIAWNRLVAEHKVTLWCSVPAILEMLLSCQRGDELRSLRLIAQGGDYIKRAVIAELRRLDPALRLVSLGGPTETTIWSIWHEIAPEDTGQIPYGRPLPGNSYFILNERGGHCPPGVVGRIHTAGVNVALGYLQDGVLSQHDFITVADEAGKPVRAFRTGDRGRYRHDGNILFASRVDGYVKVRGVRVSLPDIEAELGGHPDLRQLLVVDCGVEQRGEAEIGVIYVPAQAGKPSAADLRAHARRVLPESHVPTRFVEVETLPLSANGKPDRRKARELLAAAAERREPAAAKAAPPANPRSRKILDLYLAVLGEPASAEIDDTTDFIRLGLLPSHLKSVASRIRDELNTDLTPHQLLRCRNAGQVALLLRDQER